MVAYKTDNLKISIDDTSPAERRDCLILGIAAAIRWNATAEGKYTNDGDNLFVLAQLLEQLVEVKETVG